MRGTLTDTRWNAAWNAGPLMAGALRACAIVTFVSLAWTDTTAAAQATLTLSGERRTVACDGGTLRLTGQKNTVTVTGECRKVDISGTGNTVSIEVTGANNRVTWQRALNGDAPRVSTTGLNTITRATAPPAAEPVTRAPASPGASAAPSAKASPRAAGARREVTTPATTDDGIVVQEDDRKDAIDCGGRQVSISAAATRCACRAPVRTCSSPEGTTRSTSTPRSASACRAIGTVSSGRA